MARRAFYSFHYKPDCTRASQVRNMGVIEGNAPATDNDWETVTRGGDSAIQRWIDNQLNGKSCTIVLIGSETAKRKWIDYEIQKSWNDRKGLLGIHIHNLKNLQSQQSYKGEDPFSHFTLNEGRTSLSSIVRTYDPPHYDSKQVYAYIQSNLANWIEEAISIRQRY